MKSKKELMSEMKFLVYIEIINLIVTVILFLVYFIWKIKIALFFGIISVLSLLFWFIGLKTYAKLVKSTK